MMRLYAKGSLFDTNILIDHLKAIEPATTILENTQILNISIITWIEVMVGTILDNKSDTELFLKRFNIIFMNQAIADLTIEIRKKKRMKLPDAIIWATAKNADYHLVTRNHKDFAQNEAGIIIPYTLHPQG